MHAHDLVFLHLLKFPYRCLVLLDSVLPLSCCRPERRSSLPEGCLVGLLLCEIRRYQYACASFGYLLLCFVHFLLIGRPSFVSLLEELSNSFSGLSTFLIDGLPSLQRGVFILAVFLDEGVLQAVVKIDAVPILFFFLNKQVVTLLLQDERDRLFSLMISP